ncbi:hypothetical protein PXD04_10860 [Methanosphaera sp. ISO3-F5]|uniref:hypothetical protein n=1 Tax=Methanosphaera sp. ISO3-F5 TaxID=1452353 RepID=UPI002B256B1F|nr:hypothetical protein [Methanosphaera sp. ISO3-F5]WQH64192.1 hypothetical protein PXD04_10860 [Methanosphaera sp. ISO3-F5]
MKYKFLMIISIFLLLSLSVISAESLNSTDHKSNIDEDTISDENQNEYYNNKIIDKPVNKQNFSEKNKVINKSYKNYYKNGKDEGYLTVDNESNQFYVFYNEEKEITVYLMKNEKEIWNKSGDIKFSITYFPAPWPGNLVVDTVVIGHYPLKNGICKFNYTLHDDAFNWEGSFPENIHYDFEYHDKITNKTYDYRVYHLSLFRDELLDTIIWADDKISARPGQKIVFKARIVDNFINPVKTGRIAIKINGRTIKSDIYLNNCDEFSYSYTIPKNFSAKHYNLEYVYVGNEVNPRAVKTISLNILKKSVKISTKNITAYPGQNIIINGNVTHNKKPITDGRIVIKLNGKTINANITPNKYGEFKHIYKIPSSFKAKTYNITTIYIENKKYARKEINTTLTIKKQASKITVNNITNYQNKTARLSINITGVKTKIKATSGNVTIIIRNKQYVKKITKGTTVLNYKIPLSLKAGKYKITIFYSGGKNLYKANTTTFLTVKDNTTIIQSKNIKATRGKTIKISATINDSIGYIKRGNATFKINNETIGSCKIINGSASINYKVPESFHGKYKLQILAKGTYTDVNEIQRKLVID